MANQTANMSVVKERLSQVTSHMTATGRAGLLEKHPDDIVVTTALRTPITKGGKGGFKDTASADLLHGAFVSLLQRSGIDPNLVEDIAVGNVLAPGGGATEFRAAALAAGFPESTAVKSLNRQCSSGLQACVDIANAIRCGMIEIGIGAGVESMSTQYGPQAVSEFSELLENHKNAAECKVPMGVLSEQMAKDRDVSRAEQDKFAVESYRKAGAAQKQGLFDEEIAPLKVKYTDPKTDEEKEITVSVDDGVREVTVESLGKIKPAFAKDGEHSKATLFFTGMVLTLVCRFDSRGQRVADLGRCRSGPPYEAQHGRTPRPKGPGQVRRRIGGRRAPSPHGYRSMESDPGRAGEGGCVEGRC